MTSDSMTSDSSGAGLLSRRSREVLSTDGTRLFVEEYGLGDDAPLLVFSHGWACQGRFWRPQIEHFANTHRVVVYDQRGHGWSDRGHTLSLRRSSATTSRLSCGLSSRRVVRHW